jgi:hypothetical protein
VLFGALVETGQAGNVALGYYLGAAVMIVGGLAELALGVEAARRPLEDVATPLSAEGDRADVGGDEDGDTGGSDAPAGVAPRRSGGGRDGDDGPVAPGSHPLPRAEVDGLDRDLRLGAILQALGRGPLTPGEPADRVGGGGERFDAAVRHGPASGVLVDAGEGRIRACYDD